MDENGSSMAVDNENVIVPNGDGNQGENVVHDGDGDQAKVGENTTSQDVLKPTKSKGTRVKRSKVWTFFDMLPLSQTKNIPTAKCKHCPAKYNCASSNGTGNMKRHMEKCPRTNTRDINQLMIERANASLRTCNFDAQRFRELVASAVVMHDLPFQFTEYEGIRTCFEYLCPDVKCVSRNTIKADILKMHESEKVKIRSLLKSAPGRISLTSDCWSSITMDGYLCLTAHFVDNDWNLHKRVLNFSFFPPPHSGVALCDKIISLLRDWKIDNRIFSLTLDNASANDASAELMVSQFGGSLVADGKLFHVRCCAHIVNLVVQDGLKDIEPCVHKIRESIKYVRGSQSRRVSFLDVVNQMNLDSKKGLRQDVATRWNSTYLMLESALFYRRAFCHLALLDSNYRHCLNSLEWEKVEKICSFLGLFYEISTIFSGTKYPTANLYFPCVSTCYEFLMKSADDQEIRLEELTEDIMHEDVHDTNISSNLDCTSSRVGVD